MTMPANREPLGWLQKKYRMTHVLSESATPATNPLTYIVDGFGVSE